MDVKFDYAGSDEEEWPRDSYESFLDAHTMPVQLPNGNKTEMVLNAPPNTTVEWVKKRIMELHYSTTVDGKSVDANDYELVVICDNLDQPKNIPLEDSREFETYNQELLHSAEIHLALKGQYPPTTVHGVSFDSCIKHK